MTIEIKHAKVSGKPDGPDATLIQPSDWNNVHALTMATAKIIGRYSGGSGAAQEIGLGTDFQFSGGNLALSAGSPTWTAGGALAVGSGAGANLTVYGNTIGLIGSDAAAATNLILYSSAPTLGRTLSFRHSDNTARWNVTVNGAESGANAGSNFGLYSFTDAGAFLSTVMFADRATGKVIFGTNSAGTERAEIYQSADAQTMLKWRHTGATSGMVAGLTAGPSPAGAVHTLGAYPLSLGTNNASRMVLYDTYIDAGTLPINAQNTPKAWVAFNGTTGVVNRGYNVTSVTKNTTGDFTINFTNSIGGTDYAVLLAYQGAADSAAGLTDRSIEVARLAAPKTVNSLRIRAGTNAGAASDTTEIYAAVFR